MKKCTVHHTGIFKLHEGVIENGIVYLAEDDNLYLPEREFMLSEECENGLTQFEVDGKWGFSDISTGEIILEPVWDYAGPFYYSYAHVSVGCQVKIGRGIGNMVIKGGKHGYIDMDGEIVIPLEYEEAEDIPYLHSNFRVKKDGKWGLVDNDNKTLIPFKWDELDTGHEQGLIFCGIKEEYLPKKGQGSAARIYKALFDEELEPGMSKNKPNKEYNIKWGVYDQNFNLIISPELDEKPVPYSSKGKELKYSRTGDYYLLRKGRKHGLLRQDGYLMSRIDKSKKQIIEFFAKINS